MHTINTYFCLKPAPHWGRLSRAPFSFFSKYLRNWWSYQHETFSTFRDINFTYSVTKKNWYPHCLPLPPRWAENDVRVIRRFWCKIKGFTDRPPAPSYYVSTNLFALYDIQLIGIPNCYVGFSKFWKRKKWCKNFQKMYVFYLQFSEKME